MFLAGFATFSLLNCVQALLPEFAQDFHVGPAQSSLALSLTTASLAIAILCADAVSEVDFIAALVASQVVLFNAVVEGSFAPV